MGTKEKTNGQANVVPQDVGDDYTEQSERSPFEIMDDVESGGGYSLASISEETEKEIEAEQSEVEGDDTGLKAFGDKPKVKDEDEDTPDPDETEGDETAEEETGEEETGEEEGEEAEESEDETEEEESEEEETEEEADTTFEAPDWLAEKLKSFDENVDITDPEAVQATLDDMNSFREKAQKADESLEKERDANKAFYELLEGSDELREIARFMHKHEVSFDKAMASLDIEPQTDLDTLKKEDPDAYLEVMEKRKQQERQQNETKAQREAREANLKENADTSSENTQAFKDEFGYDDKEFNKLSEKINPQLENLANNLVTKDFLAMVHKGLTFDEAVEQARQEGITKGKNMKIEDFKNQKRGDGLPNLGSKSPKSAEEDDGDIFSRALEPPKPISEIS